MSRTERGSASRRSRRSSAAFASPPVNSATSSRASTERSQGRSLKRHPPVRIKKPGLEPGFGVSGPDVAKRAFADALGRLIADQVWTDLCGNSAAEKCESAPADQNQARFAGVESEPTELRDEAHS